MFAMPDLGIGEALVGLSDFLPSLFGVGEAVAPAAEAIAPAALDVAGPSVLGTATDFLGQSTFDALTAAGTGIGPDVLSTAGTALALPDLLGPGAGVGFGSAADAALSSAASTGLASGTSSIPSATTGLDAILNATPTTGFGTSGVTATPSSSAQLPSNVANANAKASVFDTGTSPITGTGSGFQPAAANA